PGIARESRWQIAESLRLSALMQADLVVVHPGRRTSSRDPVEAAWGRLLEWLDEIDLSAKSAGVRIGLELMENRPKEIFMLAEDARRVMEENWSHIGLTIDLAHLNTHGDPLAYLDKLEPDWIWQVQLSDNAVSQTHLPLGKGEMDVERALIRLCEK